MCFDYLVLNNSVFFYCLNEVLGIDMPKIKKIFLREYSGARLHFFHKFFSFYLVKNVESSPWIASNSSQRWLQIVLREFNGTKITMLLNFSYIFSNFFNKKNMLESSLWDCFESLSEMASNSSQGIRWWQNHGFYIFYYLHLRLLVDRYEKLYG